MLVNFVNKQIKNTIKDSDFCSKDYAFLDENEHLGKNICLLTLGGSYSYGTNVEGSDIDIRGIASNSVSDILGLTNFEQVVDENTDTTVYAFNKIINLLMNCNPNVLEMLGCLPEHYLYLNDIGRQLIENRKLFISQKAIHSFGGYAIQQLRRLENAIARDKLPQSKKEEHILETINEAMTTFVDRYEDLHGGIVPFIGKSNKEDLDTEILVNVNLNGYPLRDFTAVINDMKTIVRDYDKLNGRNHKKDDAHLNKHAAHLLRLYYTCIDIFEKGDIVTYRKNEHDILMKTRNGYFMNEDGTYKNEFFDILNDLKGRLEYAKANTSIPKTPDFKKIQDFVIAINRKIVQNSR